MEEVLLHSTRNRADASFVHLVSKLRLRVVLLLVAIIPMAVAAIAMVGLARKAHQEAYAADRTSADLDVFLGMRDLQAGVDAEMYLYTGWAEYVLDSGDTSIPTSMIKTLISESLEQSSIAAHQTALAAAKTDDQVAAIKLVGNEIAAARQNFSDEKFYSLFETGKQLSIGYEAIDAEAETILSRHDYSWIALQEQAVYNARLSREINGLTSLSLMPSVEAHRQQIAIFSAETDLAFERFVATIAPADQVRMESALAQTDLVRLRQLLSASVVPEYDNLSTVLTAIGSFDPFVLVVDEIRRDFASTVAAKANQDAATAKRDFNLFLAGATAIVLLPGLLVLVVSHNLSRRLTAVADAAKDLSNGKLGVYIEDIHGQDEIATVGRAFNAVSVTMSMGHAQISALADGRYDAEVLDKPLPGEIGKTLRLALRRLSNTSSELAHLACHDRLTGLLDRRGLHQYMLTLPAASGSIAIIDLDRFKEVNDTYGHKAGDAVLIAVSDRLQSLCRAKDAVARVGGDEFVVATGIEGQDRLSKLVAEAQEIIRQPVEWEGHQLVVAASIGFTNFDATETYESALSRADTAMYRAKRGEDSCAVLAEAPSSR